MEEWWKKTDCALTQLMITSLIAEQAPALDVGSVRYLSEGWDSWVYTAVAHDGASWILRFPKRAGVARRLEREIVLLPLLAPRLRLCVPSFGLLGTPGAGYPHKFVGYRRLPGRPTIEADLSRLDGASLGVVLGSFLATLHDCPIEIAQRCGVEVSEVETADETAEHISAAEVQLATYGSALDERARERTRAILRRPISMQPDERCLLHNDFFPEHLLIEDTHLVGVIDWGDVAIGDPARDLAGLQALLGAPGLIAGIDTYVARRTQKPDASTLTGLAERARFIAVCRALEDLEYGTRTGRDPYVRNGLRTLRLLQDS